VWAADSGDSFPVVSSTFDVTQWVLVDAGTLSGVDRTMGFYTPTANQPGLQLPLLIDGVDYPGVQVSGVLFNQDSGFDVGNYDINPYDNISYGPEGRPTYDDAILDAVYESSYLDLYLGTRPTDVNVDGGAYVDQYSSHAPEELIPGAEFDTLDMRVYTTPGADWEGAGHASPIGSVRVVYDPANPDIYFGGLLDFPMAVLVFNVTKGLGIEATGYDWLNYTISVAPDTYAEPGDIVEVLVIGPGGGNQVFHGSFIGDEIGNTAIVPYYYAGISGMCIYNGEEYIDPSRYTISPLYDTASAVDAVYNPNNSSDNVIYVSSTVGILPGALVVGTGFTSGQTVSNVDSLIKLTLSAVPDSTPNGILTFEPNSGKTKVEFDTTFTNVDRVNICALGYETPTTYSWSLPCFQTWIADGSLELVLTNSLQGTNPANIIVVRNGVRARPSEGARYVSDGSSTTFDLPSRGGYSQSLISNNDVAVYVNNQPLVLGIGFLVDEYVPGYTRTFTLTTAPTPGTEIEVSVRTAAQYWVSNNVLQFRPSEGLSPQEGDIIDVITWNDTAQQGLLTQVFVGPVTEGVVLAEGYDETEYDQGDVPDATGSYDYSVGAQIQKNIFDTGRPIIDPERLQVTLNGNWLFFGNDFTVEGSAVVILGAPISPIDVVSITSFGQTVVPGPMTFRIFQDMRGLQATYRITTATTTLLTQPLSSTDDIIYVYDASKLSQPALESNIWGVLTINGERIMYRERDTVNNTISSLLRGTAGTGAADHEVGSEIYDIGRGNLLPPQYQDYVDSGTFLGDGSTVNFKVDGVFVEAGLEDAVLVFVGGIRITNGYTVLGLDPVEVEFDEPPLTGVEVAIVVKHGVTWYHRGLTTPSDGVPLQITNTQAARFLRGD
jgi:hypothetical protein